MNATTNDGSGDWIASESNANSSCLPKNELFAASDNRSAIVRDLPDSAIFLILLKEKKL
jgi:hypothetical protein